MAGIISSTRQQDAAGAVTPAASAHRGVDRFVIPAYITAAIFVITAAVDIITLALPANPGAVIWRFGTVGAASNYMMTAFFGIAMACGTAMYYGHRAALRVFAVACLLGAILLALLIGDFGLNVAQLRGSVPETEQSAFGIGTAKATLKYGMTIIGFLALARACWKAAKILRR